MFEAGLSRRDLDRAGGGVAPCRSALGALQDAEVLDVEELPELLGRRVHRNPVVGDADGSRRVRREVGEPDASNEEGGHRARGGLDLEVGREGRDVRHVRGADGLEVLRVERDDGARVGRFEERRRRGARHDHFFDTRKGIFARGFLRVRQASEGDHEQARECVAPARGNGYHGVRVRHIHGRPLPIFECAIAGGFRRVLRSPVSGVWKLCRRFDRPSEGYCEILASKQTRSRSVERHGQSRRRLAGR